MVEKALLILDEFVKIYRVKLNIGKTKAMWLGKWANNRSKLLISLKWVNGPTRSKKYTQELTTQKATTI